MPDEPEPHVTVTATVTDRWGDVESVYAGTQPSWAWSIDRCAAWRQNHAKAHPRGPHQRPTRMVRPIHSTTGIDGESQP